MQSIAARPQLWIAAGAALLLLTGLGALDLWAPDEPRYAQVAEELRSGSHGAQGLALLHLNGEAYTQKPPLYFWLAAGLGFPAGRVTETAARLPSALAGIATVWLVARLGARLLGSGTGLLGAALLLTAWEFAWRARRAQLDVLLTGFEVVALAAFWRWVAEGSRRSLALLHCALGLAVLTKGPVGWLVPLLGMATFLVWERRWRELPRLVPPWALVLSLGPALLWLGLAASAAPEGFVAEAVGTNLFARFFLGSSHARPLYYYLYQFPIAFLPWTLLAPAVWLVARREVFSPAGEATRARAWRFLLAWLGAAFVFFSLSAGKRGLYLLPAFPAAALLCADAARSWLAPRLRRPARVAVLGLVAVGALELALFTLALPRLDSEKSPRPVAAAAAALAPPGEPVGLLAKDTLVGGLVYYGERPVTVLSTPQQAAEFLAAGGRAVVVAERDLDSLQRLARVRIWSRSRSGARALLVVRPADD